MHARNEQRRLVGDQPRVALEEAALAHVIGFLRELALGLGRAVPATSRSSGRRLKSRSSTATLSTSLAIERATPGYWIFSARSRPSGVVARCTCPIDAAATGSQSKRGEAPLPALAVLAAEHAPKLLRRHRRGLRAQHRQRLREFRRQDIVALERHELPDLHGRAAQAGKPCREPSRVGAGQQRAAEVGRFAARESPQPLRGRADGELSRRKPDARETAEAGLGNRGG